jgi:phosphatidate cytidylyltransferase
MALAGAVAVVGLARAPRRWAVLGFVYAGVAFAASLLVRGDDIVGFQALILVFLVVWVTDSLGYFVGRGVGGPKLWPRVSPNKTWAGALGGLFGSIVVGAGFSIAGYSAVAPALVLSGLLSVASQLGDLFESAVKRRFGVKDSGQIIPGHGGLLDRLDGYVAAIAVAALIGLWRGGFDGVGHGLVIW